MKMLVMVNPVTPCDRTAESLWSKWISKNSQKKHKKTPEKASLFVPISVKNTAKMADRTNLKEIIPALPDEKIGKKSKN